MFSKSLVFSQSVAVLAASSIAFGASPAIGIVTASGHFTVDRSEVWSNSTLFDGATVETAAASSEMSLANGVKLQLGSQSRARIWQNHAALQKGVGQSAGSYEIDAAGLKIRGASGNAHLRVGLADRVEVAALSGSARVMNGAGLLLASIPAGHAMSFNMQAGTTGAVTRTGCLLYKDGRFILQDENTQEVAELNGAGLAPDVGNRVQIAGTATSARPDVSPATLAINVSSVVQKSEGGCLTTAAALGAQANAPAVAPPGTTPGAAPQTPSPAPPASGGGLSKGAKI
ncbi:MAG: hypothetical protein ACRD30_08315 [Bryobacteraceae bacterium]